MPLACTLSTVSRALALLICVLVGLVAPLSGSGQALALASAQLLSFDRQSGLDLARAGNQPPAPDGQPDAVLRLVLQAPGDRLTGIELRSTSGGPLLVWDADPQNAGGHWRGAVVVGGQVRNAGDGRIDLPLGPGPLTLDYHFAPAQHLPRLSDGVTELALTLSLASGQRVVLPVPAGFERSAPAPSLRDLQPGADAIIERVFWESIMSSTDPREYLAYLQRWPDGSFAELARLRMDRLSASAQGHFPSGGATGESWTAEENARFGTRIRYPADRFTAQPMADNADGRRFLSTGGSSGFLVFGQHDIFATPVNLALQQDLALGGFDRVLAQDSTAGGYIFTAQRGDEIVHRRLLLDGLNGVLHVFEGFYPASRAQIDGPLLERIAGTMDFGLDEPAPGVTGSPGLLQDGLPARPPRDPAAYQVPARDSALRQALVDAARIPVAQELGRAVIFRIETLRTSGDWAFLMGSPLEPDGTPFDWSRSPYARDWAADVMSDLVMVLLIRDRHGWRALHHVIGPTDVAWVDWMQIHDLPDTLFFAP